MEEFYIQNCFLGNCLWLHDFCVNNSTILWHDLLIFVILLCLPYSEIQKMIKKIGRICDGNLIYSLIIACKVYLIFKWRTWILTPLWIAKWIDFDFILFMCSLLYHLKLGVYCGQPPNNDAKNIMLMGRSYYYGDRIVYMCRRGLQPAQSPSILTCQEDGTWDKQAACIGK